MSRSGNVIGSAQAVRTVTDDQHATWAKAFLAATLIASATALLITGHPVNSGWAFAAACYVIVVL